MPDVPLHGRIYKVRAGRRVVLAVYDKVSNQFIGTFPAGSTSVKFRLPSIGELPPWMDVSANQELRHHLSMIRS